MDRLVFTVDSALLSELGEKLVETPHIALVELVKNAYDADASAAGVLITPRPPNGPEIQIIDNGTGMLFHEVQDYWMRIATTHKVNAAVSQRYGRPRTGSKGIGRFSCRRLGTRLKIHTVAAAGLNGFEVTDLEIDWTLFTPGSEIDTVECIGAHAYVDNAETGTTLTISGADRDEMGKRGLDFLRRQLAVLAANRGRVIRGYDEDPGFDVSLAAPTDTGEIVNLRDRLLTAGWGHLDLSVADDGTASIALNALTVGECRVTHPQKFRNLASVSARIGIMPVDRAEMRDTSVITKGTLGAMLNEWGGVYVRHRGFRVYPYGEPGNDWLEIERDRAARKPNISPTLSPFAAALEGVNPQRALLSLLSAKSYIGDVVIGDHAVGFLPKANREGFVGEDAVDSLRQLVRFAIDWATVYREFARKIVAEEAAQTAKQDFERQVSADVGSSDVVSAAIGVVQTEFRSIASRLPPADRDRVMLSVDTATRAIQTRDTANREELRHLRLVASTSTLLLIFSHEVKALLSWLEQVSISLTRVSGTLGGPEAARVLGIRDEFAENKQRFVDLLSMTSLLSVNSQDATAVNLTLLPRLTRAVRCFDLIAKNYQIDIDVTGIPETLKVGPMLEAELYAVLLNLLSNSIKSVIAAGGPKRILISAERREKMACVHVFDTGIGLDPESFDRVFQPFVADPDERLYSALRVNINPEDEYVVGTGSGLGLSIVSEILNYRHGSIRFVRPDGNWAAHLEACLP